MEDLRAKLAQMLKAKEMEMKKEMEKIKREEENKETEIPEIIEEEEIPKFEEEYEKAEEQIEETRKEYVEEFEKPEEVVEKSTEEFKKVVNKEKENKVMKMKEIEKPVKVVKAPVERESYTEVSVGRGTVQLLRSVESPEEAELEDIKYMIAEVMPDAVADYVIDIAGKPVLTYAGILRAVVETGNIECTVEPVEISQRRVIFKAKAKHLEKNVIVEGIGVVDLDIEEDRIRRLKEKYKNDTFRIRNYDEQLARLKEYKIQIAFSRAQRNALKYLINEREWAHRFKRMLIRRE